MRRGESSFNSFKRTTDRNASPASFQASKQDLQAPGMAPRRLGRHLPRRSRAPYRVSLCQAPHLPRTDLSRAPRPPRLRHALPPFCCLLPTRANTRVCHWRVPTRAAHAPSHHASLSLRRTDYALSPPPCTRAQVAWSLTVLTKLTTASFDHKLQVCKPCLSPSLAAVSYSSRCPPLLAVVLFVVLAVVVLEIQCMPSCFSPSRSSTCCSPRSSPSRSSCC